VTQHRRLTLRALCTAILFVLSGGYAQSAVDLAAKRSICRNTVMIEALRAWGKKEAGLTYQVPAAYTGQMEEPMIRWAVTVAVQASMDAESAMVTSLLKCEANLAEALQYFARESKPMPIEHLK
jgi:hypothetical protein